MIEVLQAGLSTTVQDRGRPGFYNVGIPPSGALDQFSLLAANILVGNDEGAAVLEFVYQGPELRFKQPALVAVTGADLAPRLNGEDRPAWEAFPVAAGDIVSFDYLRGGARSYLGVAGGIDVPAVLGSRSTYALGAMGGLEGRSLQAGDQLAAGPASSESGVGRSVPVELRPSLPDDLRVRVVMGLYDHRLTPAARRTFLSSVWTLTPVADRVGFRYRGPALEFIPREQPFGAGSDPSNIVDAPYPIGSIQIPGGLEPIVLHRDAISGGGYAMIGTVISSDMDAIAQSAPNSRTRFVEVDLGEALVARRAYHDRVVRLREV